jgi:hypothetical protein
MFQLPSRYRGLKWPLNHLWLVDISLSEVAGWSGVFSFFMLSLLTSSLD